MLQAGKHPDPRAVGAKYPLIAGDLLCPPVHPAPSSCLAPASCTWPDTAAQQPSIPVSEPTSPASCSCQSSPGLPPVTLRGARLLLGVVWVRCSHQSDQLCVQDGECRQGPWSRVHWGNGSEHGRQSPCFSQSTSRPTTRAAACAERSPRGCGCSPTKTNLYSLNRLNVSAGEELGRPGEKREGKSRG